MEPASAIVGLAFAGGQVLNAALRLRKLWKQIEDVPDDLKDLLADLDGSMVLLKQVSSTLPADDITLQEYCRRYQTIHKSLQIMAAELDNKLQRKRDSRFGRRLIAFKAVMDDDDWKKHQAKLKSTRDALHFAISLSQSADVRRMLTLFESHQVMHFADLSKQVNEQLHSRSLVGERTSKEVPADISSTADSLVAKAQHSRTSSRSIWTWGKLPAFTIDKSNQAWAIRIQSPDWWSPGSIYELISRPSLSSYIFRTYNMVSDESEVIRGVMYGDTVGIRKLFQDKAASPFDITEDGQSLLYHAASYKQPEMCQLLLQCGLGEILDQPVGKKRDTPLTEILKGFNSARPGRPDDSRDEVIEVFQTYLRNSDSPSLQSIFDYIHELAYNDEYIKVFQDKFLLNYYGRPVEERAEAIRQGVFTDVSTCETLRRLLCRSGQILRTDVETSTKAKLSLLQSAAVCMGRRFGEEAVQYKRSYVSRYAYGPVWSEWSDWVTDVARVSGLRDLHAMETLTPPTTFQVPQWTGTPLISVLGAMLCWLCPKQPYRMWNMALQKALKEWLKALKAGGVKLDAYGEQERSLFHGKNDMCKGAFDSEATRVSSIIVRSSLAEGTSWIIAFGPLSDRTYPWVPIRLIDIEFGADVEDWNLLWVWEFEYLAFEFWESIERAAHRIPGMWVDT